MDEEDAKRFFDRYGTNILHRVQIDKKKRELEKDIKHVVLNKRKQAEQSLSSAVLKRTNLDNMRQKKLRKMSQALQDRVFIPTQNDWYHDKRAERHELQNLQYARR